MLLPLVELWRVSERLSRVRIDRARHIGLAPSARTRARAVPRSRSEPPSLSTRRSTIWESLAVGDEERRRDERLELAAGLVAGLKRTRSAATPRAPTGSASKARTIAAGTSRRADDVGERHAVAAMRLALLRLALVAAERGRAAFPVDDRELAPIAVRRCGRQSRPSPAGL